MRCGQSVRYISRDASAIAEDIECNAFIASCEGDVPDAGPDGVGCGPGWLMRCDQCAWRVLIGEGPTAMDA